MKLVAVVSVQLLIGGRDFSSPADREFGCLLLHPVSPGAPRMLQSFEINRKSGMG